jgi:integrase
MDTQEQQYTISQILDRFLRDYVPNLAPRTQGDYARHVRDLRKWFGHFLASELKPRHFAEFMNVTRGKKQRNKQLAVLSCAMGEAVGRWYWAEANPCRDVKRHPHRPRDREVTDKEFAEFRLMVPFRMKLAMDLSVLTGQRQGDILGLKWAQVDREAGVIRFRQSKTGKRVAVRITTTLEAALERCTTMAPQGEHVIRRRDGQRYTSDGFRAIWQRYQRRWAKLGKSRFTYHDLRARAAGKCKTIEEAMMLLGHGSMQMTRRVYDRVERVVEPTA